MFKRKAIKSTGNNWDEAADLNQQIKKLRKLKIKQIRVEGPLEKSKLAWKIATLHQAYLYRLVELAEATSYTWNKGFYISSLTLARSIIETGVILCELDEIVETHLENENIDALNDFIMSRNFSTRLEDFLTEGKFYKATSILTILEKKDREIPGLMGVYDRLSEHAHPNHLGHFQHYADLDHSDGTVNYIKGKFLKPKFHSILCAFSFVALGYNASIRLGKNIEKVAEVQHRLNPVK